MKTTLALVFLVASAGLVHATIVENISFDLTALHPGSTLSGNFTLSNTPAAGDTALASLTFSDPANYTPTSLSTTVSILSGTPSGFAFDFSPISFTNLSGVVTPINTRDVTLTRTAFAQCAALPCTATGRFEDRNPPVFTAEYTITPVEASGVPEPAYGLLVATAMAVILFARRFAMLRHTPAQNR